MDVSVVEGELGMTNCTGELPLTETCAAVKAKLVAMGVRSIPANRMKLQLDVGKCGEHVGEKKKRKRWENDALQKDNGESYRGEEKIGKFETRMSFENMCLMEFEAAREELTSEKTMIQACQRSLYNVLTTKKTKPIGELMCDVNGRLIGACLGCRNMLPDYIYAQSVFVCKFVCGLFGLHGKPQKI